MKTKIIYILLCFVGISLGFAQQQKTSFAEKNTEAIALAPIGSHWNYWFADEYTYGFIRYEVVADTFVKAAVYEFPTDTISVEASLIRKIKFRADDTVGAVTGEFLACKRGNTSYVWEKRKKQWFKWIDMDAKPGDRWLMIETSNGSQGVIDYVEVAYKDTTEIDGQKIPIIRMMPACTSRFTTGNDFTSRIRMTGMYNIDFLSLNFYPEVYANGMINKPIPEVIYLGLLCGKNGDKELVRPILEEYVRDNNPWMYEKGIVDCDSLQAPKRPENSPTLSGSLERLKKISGAFSQEIIETDNDLFPLYEKWEEEYQEILHKSRTQADDGSVMEVPVVVHIVHNPADSREKITEAQVYAFLEEINAAYTQTKENQVREEFKSAVGNPNIKFVLTTTDEDGNLTSGIVYHETTKDYFPLTGKEITEKYAFKFDALGKPYNWDNQKYINIYVADLGGMDGKTSVGGFVTQPLTTSETYGDMLEWIQAGKSDFWRKWIPGKEAQAIDGLAVDIWHTFGGASAQNPNATSKTAIHELGHYFGIRHPNIVLVTDSDGKTLLCDDGFEDTPWTHYTQYAETACDNTVTQCGNLVQVENYMDYALPCAAMFTKEQVAYMRTFLKECRNNMGQVKDSVGIGQEGEKMVIKVYPNPNKGTFYVETGSEWLSPKLRVYTVLGVEVPIQIESRGNRVFVSSDVLKKGLYILKINEGLRMETCKFSVN